MFSLRQEENNQVHKESTENKGREIDKTADLVQKIGIK
jgi:hypothetical protein